jgi:hypothetical protein
MSGKLIDRKTSKEKSNFSTKQKKEKKKQTKARKYKSKKRITHHAQALQKRTQE